MTSKVTMGVGELEGVGLTVGVSLGGGEVCEAVGVSLAVGVAVEEGGGEV